MTTYCNRNTVFAIAVLLSSFTATQAVADDASNAAAKTCQAIQGSAWSAASVASLATPPTFPLTKFAEDSAAYGANIALKLCPPQITAPAPVKRDPDPPVPGKPDAGCYATFHQHTTDGDYHNYYGASLWNKIDQDWGDFGKPRVYDFNTDVYVRMVDPAKIASDFKAYVPGATVGLFDDGYEPGDIVLPVGYNSVEWRADTAIGLSDIVFIPIPEIPPGNTQEEKALLEESPKLAEFITSEAKDVVTAVPTENKVLEKLLPEFLKENLKDTAKEELRNHIIDFAASINTGVFFTGHDLLKEGLIANADIQDVWVYDNDPPTLQTNTDPSAFPPNLQPLVSYDPVTGTYYVEATGPGIPDASVEAMAQSLLIASDKCQGNRPALAPFRVTGSGVPSTPAVWHPGDTGTFEWQVQDSGPNHNGQPNLSNVVDQKFGVRDTHPPVLLAPPSKVVEIAPTDSSLTVALGSPQSFDLADYTPSVAWTETGGSGVSNGADSISVTQPGINTITWTATDASGNSVQEQQLINVKVAGTNTAPIANDQSVNAVSDNPIDIVLTGYDADVDPNTGRHDPLSFTIKNNPAHGHFIAPLLPYFIDDYRLGPASLRFAGVPQQSDPAGYCTSQSSGFSGSWQMEYPYNASWITVDDDGSTVVYDQGNIICAAQGIDSANAARLALFDVNGNLVRTVATGDIFVNAIYMNWRTKGIYIAYNTDPGTGNIVYYDKNFNSLGSFSTTGRSNSSENVANPKAITADNQGIVYFANNNQIAAYQGPTSAAALTTDNSYKFLGMLATVNDPNITGTIKSMATDSQNNLYISIYFHG